jgi:small subunit ribosomal protein S9
MTEDTPTIEPTTPTEAPATPEVVESLPSELLTPEPEVVVAATPTAGGWFWGTGRRKASVARVRVRSGSGEFKINGRDLTEFFTEERDHKTIGAVLDATKTTGGVEVAVKVHGGGYTGQAGAIILGLGRALMRYDGSLEPTLRKHGFLSRDPRRVERKKPGQPGARKRFQFSKR